MNDQEKKLEQEKRILDEEKRVLEEEHAVLDEEKKVLAQIRRTGIMLVVGALVIGVGAAAGLYLRVASERVGLDKAQIAAPAIALAPQNAGILEETYVQEGDFIRADAAVARVGNEIVKAKVDGTVLAVRSDVGKLFSRGETVATMIDPREMRVVAQADEDKGLKDIRVGQIAVFTVDAFGSKKFSGTVDEVSPTSRESGIVFNISDKRATQIFDVKIRFNTDAYPELKNGMSAKVVIYKN